MKTLGIGALVIGALPALASAEVFTKDWQQATLDRLELVKQSTWGTVVKA